MGAMSKEAAALRAELETAMLAEAERIGPEGFDRAAVVNRFMDRGVGRSTVFRWAAEIMKSGRIGQHVARKVKQAVAERAARTPEPAKEIMAEIEAKLPARVSVDDTLRGAGTPKVIERLNSIVAELDGLVAYAKTPEGKIRNARLLLAAAKELRGCVETGLKLYQAMHDIAEIDSMHTAILEEIGKESPEVEERILLRLHRVAERWGG